MVTSAERMPLRSCFRSWQINSFEPARPHSHLDQHLDSPLWRPCSFLCVSMGGFHKGAFGLVSSRDSFLGVVSLSFIQVWKWESSVCGDGVGMGVGRVERPCLVPLGWWGGDDRRASWGHRSQSTDNGSMLAGVAGERAMCPAFSARTNEKLTTQHLLKLWPSPFVGTSDRCKGWGLTWEVVMMWSEPYWGSISAFCAAGTCSCHPSRGLTGVCSVVQRVANICSFCPPSPQSPWLGVGNSTSISFQKRTLPLPPLYTALVGLWTKRCCCPTQAQGVHVAPD